MTPAQFRQARHALGLSCAQMAAALSDPDGDSRPVDPRTIRRWEAGDREISSPAVVAVYQYLAHWRPIATLENIVVPCASPVLIFVPKENNVRRLSGILLGYKDDFGKWNIVGDYDGYYSDIEPTFWMPIPALLVD